MIALDHIGIPARDPAGSAQFLAEILGLPPARPDGPEGEMRCLAIAQSGTLLFAPAETVTGQHVAFRVDAATFASIVNRLKANGVAFGNDPEEPTNMKTADPLGGQGRVYFSDPNGHLFEVVA
jgi:catechol 2,3-dioxygenase-like lactoylglutathione lyase family enzyme